MNPSKIKKMDEEIAKWNKKDLVAIKRSMANPGKQLRSSKKSENLWWS